LYLLFLEGGLPYIPLWFFERWEKGGGKEDFCSTGKGEGRFDSSPVGEEKRRRKRDISHEQDPVQTVGKI